VSDAAISQPPRPGPAPRVSLPTLSPSSRLYMGTEAGGSALLLVATVVALLWANSPWSASYDTFWHTPATIAIGGAELTLDLQHWVNDALMALFFLVVGLEITREVATGELRDRRSMAAPALGAVGGLVTPALVYFAFNPSGPESAGWGVVMSTDTAFVLGILALFGPRCPDRLRLFLLTIALWLAVQASGVHATLAGVVVGLLLPQRPPDDEVFDRTRSYSRALHEQPEPERARLAALAVAATIPAGSRLQHRLHRWTAYAVVPVFGLANAGVSLDGGTLRAAATSPVTLGVAVALVVGNAIGITAGAAVALRTGWGVLPGGVRWSHLMAGATLAGIGFTISLFIADLAFDDEALKDQATIGILAGSVVAAVLGIILLRVLGERFPLCSPDAPGPPSLPPRPWLDPGLVRDGAVGDRA
jgi:NhaA family Na+:H+ antiporter